jgi:hypothetical protein
VTPVGARTRGQRFQVLGVDAPLLRAWAEGFRLWSQQAGHRFLCLQEELGLRAAAAVYEYCLYGRDAIPQNNPSNAKYRLLIDAWRRLPIGLANWLGPFIVRNLG